MPSKKRKTASGPTAGVENEPGESSVVIELLNSFEKLRRSWPKDMARLLDPLLPDERRLELWEIMCDGGDVLRQRFAWAIPDERALRIVKHFGPIVEVGSGLGYWAMLLRARGVDINAYDKVAGSPDAASSKSNENQSTGKNKIAKVKDEAKPANGSRGREPGFAVEEVEGDEEPSFWTQVNKGGPSVLEKKANEKRSLFLCYPDDFEGETESLGLRCLHAFEGDVVIHVGELFGDSVSMTPGQSPWGRTTARECQEELSSKFHCILKVSLPSWPHSRDTLTVWKRHSFCAIQYGDDSDDEDGGSGDKEEGQRGNGGASSPLDDSVGVDASARAIPKGGAARVGEGREAGKGDSCDNDDEDAGEPDSSGSDDVGSVESSFPVGVPDVDMYAYVPVDEQMPYEQAAPCLQFLLGARS